MKFKIQIKDLVLFAKLGCYSWEKVITQKILVNLDITLSQELEVSCINETIDYYQLSLEIKSLVLAKHYELLEEIGADILKYVVSNPMIKKCKITIYKPLALDKLGKAYVTIEN